MKSYEIIKLKLKKLPGIVIGGGGGGGANGWGGGKGIGGKTIGCCCLRPQQAPIFICSVPLKFTSFRPKVFPS